MNAIILGASSGIGKEMALRLAKDGWRVGITGRREKLLDEIAGAFPDSILSSAFDADDVAALGGRLDELAERLGGVDLFVVSAGCGFINADLDPALELQTVATNVAAFTAAADWGYAYFKKRGRGQLAAITSVGGLIGEGAAPAYAASKAYQIMYLDGLRKRARKEKIDLCLTELRPGSVDTDMMKGDGHFWISSAARAAELACGAVLRKRKLQYGSRRWRGIGFILRCAALWK